MLEIIIAHYLPARWPGETLRTERGVGEGFFRGVLEESVADYSGSVVGASRSGDDGGVVEICEEKSDANFGDVCVFVWRDVLFFPDWTTS